MKKITRVLISLIGIPLGIGIAWAVVLLSGFRTNSTLTALFPFFLGGILGFVILFLISNFLTEFIYDLIKRAENKLDEIPTIDVLTGTLGVILGLILAFFITRPFSELSIPLLGNTVFVFLSVIIYLFLGILGWRTAVRAKPDIRNFFTKIVSGNIEKRSEKKDKIKEKIKKNLHDTVKPKILDTSVIIDGRILDMINAGFIEGKLIVPEFVLEELQHIADSSDDLKRQRGRRGLDIINEIKNSDKIKVQITNKDYKDIKEVDIKLLKMAKDLDAKVFTNDYNLNKVADVQDIEVLNINDLVNALKAVVLAGETMDVSIIKAGKEKGQGIGYLDDGTMIVVEDGEKYIGKTVKVTVTSVLQTSAGKMIFVKP
ncbi:MAG: TRAM domain-containing protein [Peptoniphilaceae bacterium]|nr:TRAM domain-containing protein [Peptoniphilaceae bacterium]MDD7382760.1 TRAM domain-containing protein [Peptoniphilaceae bacterium]MDY3737916.1 TRAM domain-containing protein [Peptoniphilaceae bacterium]